MVTLSFETWPGQLSARHSRRPRTVLRSLSIPPNPGGTASLARCMAGCPSPLRLAAFQGKATNILRQTYEACPASRIRCCWAAVQFAGVCGARRHHLNVYQGERKFSCENATGGRRRLAFALAARRKRWNARPEEPISPFSMICLGRQKLPKRDG